MEEVITVMNTRYERQITLPEVGVSGQEKLKKARVLVIGAGGLGGPVLQYLAAAGVGQIGICDNDLVDLSNLHRQILFTTRDLGLNKAKVAKNHLQKLNENCSIQEYQFRVNHLNITDLLEGHDIIIDCTDNFQTKFLIHDACFLHKKKLIQGSIYQFEGQLQCFDFSQNKTSPCLRCLWPEVPAPDCTSNCQVAGVLGVVPGVFGSLQCNEALKMILEIESLPQGKTLTLNLKNLSQRIIKWKKSSKCPLCGPQPSIYKTSHSIKLEKFEVLEKMDHYEQIDLRVESSFDENDIDPKKEYLFFCQRGIRSYQFVKKLRELGLQNTYSLFGGVDAG